MTRSRCAASVLAAGFVLLSCSSATKLRSAPVRQTFLHHAHRLAYGIQPDELKKLRFYASEEVIATVDPPVQVGAGGTVVLKALDYGFVTDFGDDWLRVSFAGGEGVVFATAGTQEDEAYLLATSVAGGRYQRLKDLPEKVLTVGAHRYTIMQGAEARLLVEQEGLREVQRARRLGAPADKQP